MAPGPSPTTGILRMLWPRVPGNKLTQKDNVDSVVQFITLAGPKQSLLLAKDLNQFCENLIYPKCIRFSETSLNEGKRKIQSKLTHDQMP